MEPLNRLKELFDKHSVKYKSDFKNGKETIDIDVDTLDPLSNSEGFRNFLKETEKDFVWSGAMAPKSDGTTKRSIWVTSKIN